MKFQEKVKLMEILVGVAAVVVARRLPAARDGLLMLIPVVLLVSHYIERWSPRRSEAEIHALLSLIAEHRAELALGALALVAHGLLHSWLTLNVLALIIFFGLQLSYLEWLRRGAAMPPPPPTPVLEG